MWWLYTAYLYMIRGGPVDDCGGLLGGWNVYSMVLHFQEPIIGWNTMDLLACLLRQGCFLG